MDKETKLKRRNFLKKSGLCAAALTLFNSYEAIASDDTDEIKRLKSTLNYFLERHAVMYEILSETLTHEKLIEVYQKFGGNCANIAVKKTEAYKGNLNKYLQELPSFDKWQEKAWFDEDKNLITIIGTKREECVCSMARTSKNPNWCHLCCAGHQKAIFEKLLGKEVEVTMGETILLGGERCNHFVKISDRVIKTEN
jgi:hypothetical protein